MRTETVDSLELPRIDVLRVVAQGSEARILDGAMDTVSRDRPLIQCKTWVRRIYRDSGSLDDILAWARSHVYAVLSCRETVAWPADGLWSQRSRRSTFGVDVLMAPEERLSAAEESSQLADPNFALGLINYGYFSLGLRVAGSQASSLSGLVRYCARTSRRRD